MTPSTAAASISDRHPKANARGQVLLFAVLCIAILSLIAVLVSGFAGTDGAQFRCFALSGNVALRACEEVVAADSPPGIRAEGHYNRGVELDSLDRHAEAVLAYEAAIRLKPHYPGAYTNMGVALSRLGRWDEAVRSYRTAIDVNPQYADAHYNLGIALAERRRWAEALEAFRNAVRLNHEDADALYNAGLMQNFLRRHEKALEAYSAAIRVRPNDAEAWGNLGMTAYLLGRYRESVDAFERARSLRPGYFDGRDVQRRAWEEARRGRHSHAKSPAAF